MKGTLWKKYSNKQEGETEKVKKKRKSFVVRCFKEHPFYSIGFIIMIVLLLLSYLGYKRATIVYNTSYPTFTKQLADDDITKITINKEKGIMIYKTKNGIRQKTQLPDKDNFKTELLEKGIWVEEKRSANSGSIFNIVLLIGVVAFLMYATKKRYDDIISIDVEPVVPDITFEDVAGNESEKREMQTIIRLLKEPETFKQIGAKIPKGILLVGPPGTGKTLFARAVAGEAQLPFFETSGSDFVKMYTGAGASRVREVFEEAREHSPCILFIDEIDAVGGKRTGGEGAEERNNTLNALLVEMTREDEIMIIAATNRPEMLDEALLRAGRLSKHITLNAPTKKDRIKIIEKHLIGKRVSEDVTTEYISSLTTGQSGAYIENLLNEAVIQSLLNEREVVTKQDINTANLQIMIKGYSNTDVSINEETKQIIAYHEAGHAIATLLLTDHEITEVSIIPSTSNVGGYTMSNSGEDTRLYKKKDLINKISISCAGRAAEYLLGNKNNDEVTTGASNDIEQATKLLYNAITVYGLGNSGAVNLKVFESDSTLIEDEMIQAMKGILEDTVKLLEENRTLLDLVANELMEHEILTGSELKELLYKSKVS